MTLDKFYTDTSLKDSAHDVFILNGKRQSGPGKKRVFSYLHELQGKFAFRKEPLLVDSFNHVPTSAGLASSSSAFAALAAAFNYHYHLNMNDKQLSRAARLGSGSACRSIFGGFSIWRKGSNDATSYAFPLNERPQMDLQLLALELDPRKKKKSSTVGMQLAQSSPFYQPWLRRNDREMEQMKQAIERDDFSSLGALAELNASEMHAVNFTASPGFTYFEPATIRAIKLVHQLKSQGLECYYTIDAGPNPKILCRLRNSKEIIRAFQREFASVRIVQASFGPGVSHLN